MENQVSSAGTPGEGFGHQFVDYIFRGYNGQETVKVASAVEHIIRDVKERHSKGKKLFVERRQCFVFGVLRNDIINLTLEYTIN